MNRVSAARPGPAGLGRDGGDADDPAGLLRHHVRDDRLGAVERVLEVHRQDLIPGRHVHPTGQGLPAQSLDPLGRRLGRPGILVGHHHVRPFGRQAERDRLADPPAPARDDGDAIHQLTLHNLTFSPPGEKEGMRGRRDRRESLKTYVTVIADRST